MKGETQGQHSWSQGQGVCKETKRRGLPLPHVDLRRGEEENIVCIGEIGRGAVAQLLRRA